jgi:signal transduction histidine kinase
LLLIALLAVVPALIAILYLQWAERGHAREDALGVNLRLARLAASEQATVFDGARRLLVTLSALPPLRGDDRRACDALLANVLRTNADYVNLTVANPDGTRFCGGAPLQPRLAASATGRAWFQRTVATRATALGEPQLSATTGRLAIMVAHPLLDRTGTVVRVAVATISLDRLNGIASRVALPPGATLTLFDRDRMIIARHPNPEAWLVRQVPDSTLLDSLSRGANADLREGTGVDGVKRLYATVPVRTSFDAGLYLGLGIDHATAFAHGDRILRQYLWLFVIVLVGAVGATLLGGHMFVLRPAQALRRVANRLATGDLSARAQLASGVAGVNDLVEAVNAMAAALDERQRERDRAEADLRNAEERMRFALGVSGVGVWEANLRTGVSHWSETCEVMHGLPPGTFAGTFEAYLDRILPEDRQAVVEGIAKAVAQRTTAELEYRAVWPDGSIRRISSSGHFFYDDDGTPVRGAGVAIDVTDRRMLEEQLRQSLKMEAVGQLAGGIAHDFNNLLTIISGNTELALRGLPGDHPVRDDLEYAQTAARRAAQLTRQLLAFSRKQVLMTEPVDVNDVAQQLTPLLRRIIGEDITVECLTGASGAITLADRAQLEQALINLAVNARDAMPGGGQLRIVTENVRLDAVAIARQRLELEPGPHVRLTVRDTGIGMTPEVLARAFEPFFTTKTVGKGTGLGLPSVYGTVKQFGGHVGMESAPGAGTTVTIWLPLYAGQPSVATGSSAAKQGGSGSGETVLLVEDETPLRHLAARVLKGAGYRVLQAGSGDEALTYARLHAGRIHLVLSDVVMPGMSGVDLMSAVRTTRPDAALLLMSGYPSDEIVRRGLRSQDFALLPKPFTPEVLLERVGAALRGQPPKGGMRLAS